MSWLGFWIFLAVLVACDCWVFSQGYDSLLQEHKTPEEKELQQLKIERLRQRNGTTPLTAPDPAKPNPPTPAA